MRGSGGWCCARNSCGSGEGRRGRGPNRSYPWLHRAQFEYYIPETFEASLLPPHERLGLVAMPGHEGLRLGHRPGPGLDLPLRGNEALRTPFGMAEQRPKRNRFVNLEIGQPGADQIGDHLPALEVVARRRPEVAAHQIGVAGAGRAAAHLDGPGVVALADVRDRALEDAAAVEAGEFGELHAGGRVSLPAVLFDRRLGHTAGACP